MPTLEDLRSPDAQIPTFPSSLPPQYHPNLPPVPFRDLGPSAPKQYSRAYVSPNDGPKYEDEGAAYARIEAEAAAHGNPEMVGMQWQEGRLTYRVSDCQPVHRVRHEPVIRTTLIKRKRIAAQEDKVIVAGTKETRPRGRGGLAFGVGYDKFKTIEETVHYRLVQAFDENGDLVRTQGYLGNDAFRQVFYQNKRKEHLAKGATIQVPRKINNLVWGERIVDGTELRTDSPDGLGPVIKRVKLSTTHVNLKEADAHRRELDLEGWPGFTYTDPFGHKSQIVWSGVVMSKSKLDGREYPEQMFAIKTSLKTGDKRTIGYELKSLKDLQKDFDYRKRHYPHAPAAGPYWEIYPRNAQSRVWLGGVALQIPTPEAQHTPPLSDFEALGMLSQPELYERTLEGLYKFEKAVNARKRKPDARMKIAALKDLWAGAGPERFTDVVNDLFWSYTTDLRRLGIQPKPEDMSRTWIIEALIAKHISNPPNHPFDDTREGRALRLGIYEERIADKFLGAAIKAEKGVKQDLGHWDHVKTEYKRKQIEHYIENHRLTDRARRGLLYGEEIRQITTRRGSSEDPPLTPQQIRRIGALIGASFTRNFY